MRSLIAAALLLATPAFAADEGRKIDFTAVLMDANGAPFLECVDPVDKECKTNRPLTLGAAAMHALSMLESGLDPVESLKRGQLAMRVYKSSDEQLTAEDITLIKKQLAKTYNPIVCYRAFMIVDPAAAK